MITLWGEFNNSPQPGDGMHPTREQRGSQAQPCGRAGDAGREALAVGSNVVGETMKKIFLSALLAFIFDSALHAQEKIEISLAHGSKAEVQTKEQLQRLLGAYDLSKWIFTRSIIIDEQAIPHSHPTLTLHTRHLKDDELLLSTFVHEQLHWFVFQKDKESEAAMKELRVLFPKIPVGFPEGSNDERGNYIHLIVIYLEYRADRELLGELKARQVMDFWATDHYTWIYKTVLGRTRDIGNVAFKYKLIPAARA